MIRQSQLEAGRGGPFPGATSRRAPRLTSSPTRHIIAPSAKASEAMRVTDRTWGVVRSQEGRGAVSRLSILAALPVIVLVLTACAGEKAGPSSGTPGAMPPTGPVQIEIWHSEPAANEDTLKRMVDRFNASQDEVRVRPVYQGSPDDVMTKLMASTGSGRVPAIVFTTEPFIQRLIDSGSVTPVQDFVDRENYDLSDLDERAVQSYSLQGKLWGMPFCVDIPLLYYNKLVFEDVSLDPERPPQSLEELRQYSQEILKRDASGNVERSGVSIAVTLWTEQIFAQQGDLLVDMNNGHDGRTTKVLFDNDTGRRFSSGGMTWWTRGWLSTWVVTRPVPTITLLWPRAAPP